jgi:ABC-2 type transport system permease protein
VTTLSHTAGDSLTMLRRQLRHQIRYPSVTLILVGMPVVFLLLFVYVLGGTLGAGLGGVAAGRAEYLEYVVPGILVIAVASVAQGTAISIAMDMTEGIVARFRTMAIGRASVLTGHVRGALLQTVIATVVVTVVAVGIGYRPDGGALGLLAALGLVLLISFALTWLSVALGMVAQNVEAASNLPLPLILLPFFGSGFVPTESMPSALRWFAEHQPFTPCIEALRALLSGTPVGSSAVIAAAWMVAIGLAGYLWAQSSYDRRSVR